MDLHSVVNITPTWIHPWDLNAETIWLLYSLWDFLNICMFSGVVNSSWNICIFYFWVDNKSRISAGVCVLCSVRYVWWRTMENMDRKSRFIAFKPCNFVHVIWSPEGTETKLVSLGNSFAICIVPNIRCHVSLDLNIKIPVRTCHFWGAGVWLSMLGLQRSLVLILEEWSYHWVLEQGP